MKDIDHSLELMNHYIKRPEFDSHLDYEKMLKEHAPSCIYLNHESYKCEGYTIFGTPVVPEFRDWGFMYNYKDREEIMSQIPNDTEILISHGPAYKVMDECLGSNENAGCEPLLKRIAEVKPLYHIFGHVHETYGVQKIDEVTHINASSVDHHYRAVNKPITFTLPRK